MLRAVPSLLVVVVTAAVVACGDAPSAGNDSAPPSPAGVTCAADERATPEGACELFASSGECASGTRPAVGSEACIAVGTTSCAAGFEKDASGWGCAPILPEATCAGATRPRLGDRACVPVGDCAAAYPVAGAIVVDPALPDAALDTTHVRTLGDALAVAPAGATLALADGTHVTEPVTVTKAVTIVGRCAARARLAPASAGGAGLTLAAKVTMRGLTLDGYTAALTTTGAGAELVAEDIVVERARSRGVFAKSGSKVGMRGSVVRGTAPIGASDQTVAVFAASNATVILEETAVLASIDAAVVATDTARTRASLSRCVVQDTKPRADGKGGGALRAFEGAHLDVAESAILGSSGMAVLTLRHEPPSPEVTISRSVIGGTVPTAETGTMIGTAVNAAFEAIVRIDESTVSDSVGIALYASAKAKMILTRSVVVRVERSRDLAARGASAIKGAELTLEDTAIVRVGAVGVGAWESGHVRMARSLVRDVGGDVTEGLPMGLGLNATAGAPMEIADSAIVDAHELGVSASSSPVRLERVLVTRTSSAPVPRFGHGILSVSSATFSISRSIVERQPGVALFCAAGGAVIGGSMVRDNAVGAHVQEGTGLAEAESAPETVPEQELVVTKDTLFVGNATRVGSGSLPLPAPIAPP